MDVINLKVRKLKNDNGKEIEVVDIYINGKNLLDILKEIEMPFASIEGHLEIAGNYMGLSPEAIFYPSEHLLGKPNTLLDYDGKVSVLECECGCEGCWPFILKISFEEDKIVWSDFEQPHRTHRSVSEIEWAKKPQGPMVFRASQI